MDGPSNGGMLYHEVQESKLCAVHCVNSALQGPFFSEFDLAALASDLDHKERQMMLEGGGTFVSEESHNVSLDGDFSIQVLQKALEDHWFCIRKVNGEWYNFDSLYPAPEHLSKFYLSAYLDSLRGFGWSIFLVRGNFPRECPMSSSEASNGYGQWLLPEDAERITKSCNSFEQRQPPRSDPNQQLSDPFLQDREDEDLKAAIAASLLDSSPAAASAEAGTTQNENKNSAIAASLLDSSPASPAAATAEAGTTQNENKNSAIAASLLDSSPASPAAATAEAGTTQNENKNSKESELPK